MSLPRIANLYPQLISGQSIDGHLCKRTGMSKEKVFAADEGLSRRLGPPRVGEGVSSFCKATDTENICALIWVSLVSGLGTFQWFRNLKAPGGQHL